MCSHKDYNQLPLSKGDLVVQSYISRGSACLKHGIVVGCNSEGVQLISVVGLKGNKRLTSTYTLKHTEKCCIVSRMQIGFEDQFILEKYYVENIYDPFDSSVGK